MKPLGEWTNGEHGDVVFEEAGFAIRIGHWGYFITHEDCSDKQSNSWSVAYDSGVNGRIIIADKCGQCEKEYSKEMKGFISMLNWER